MHNDEAEMVIYNPIKEHFNFNNQDCGILFKYFKREAPKPKSATQKNTRSKGRGKAYNDESMNQCNCDDDDCKIDPEDVDFDENDIDPGIVEKAEKAANRVMEHGNPIKYIMNTVKKVHVGDENTIEGTCISIAGQSCLNTAGIQISVNGESGSGKSHGLKSVLHLVPKRYKRSTSLSAKALFYMELRDGMIIYSDDTDMDPDLAGIFKQSTTNYQEVTYRTTVKDQKKQVVTIPPRVNIFLTCVESHVSDQVLNRQLTFETNVSEIQKHNIYVKQKQIEKNRVNQLEVTFRVLVCRKMFAMVKDQRFNVHIPFADKINILDYSNSRVYPLICDLIKGFALFNYKQREIDDKGWLVAKCVDFNMANRLFKSRVENTITKLTAPEREIVKYIINHQREEGCTVNDISTSTGIKYTTVRRLIKGRDDRQNDDGGLLAKVKGMRKEDTTVTSYIRDNGDLMESKGKKDERYKILDYNPWDLFAFEFITLDD